MKIGILGAGGIAQAVAKQLLKTGHGVMLSNSRGSESLKAVVASLGQGAAAGTVREAAAQEIVVLAVQWPNVAKVLAGLPDFAGRILVDTTTPLSAPDYKLAELGGRTASRIVAELAKGARVVKVMNTLPPPVLGADPKTHGGRRVLFMSGDDAQANGTVSRLLEGVGFAIVDVGSLDTGGVLQQFPGGSLPTLNLVRID